MSVDVVVFSPMDLERIPDRVLEDPYEEEAAFRAAVADVVGKLRRLQTDFEGTLLPGDRALF